MSVHQFRRVIAVAVGLLIVFSSGAREPAAQGAVVVTGTTVQLTTNAAAQLEPSLSGDIVVWTDQRNGNDDVYYCDVSDCAGTETQLTTLTTPQRLHDVSGHIIVYADFTPPAAEIRAFNVLTNTHFDVSGPVGAQNARIDGDLVAYEVGLPGAQDIWMTNLTTGVSAPIGATSGQELNPAVGGSRIVYERHETVGEPGDIVLYDVSTGVETVIAEGPSDQRRPDIEGNLVVYDGTTADGDLDIFIYDVTTGATTQLTRPDNQRIAHISGDMISLDHGVADGSVNDVMLYHMPTGTVHPVATGDMVNEFLNDISGNRVVYTGHAAGNFNIHLYTFEVQLPEIAVAPLTHDFGDVMVGASATTVVTISNVGSQPLAISTIALSAGSSAAFSVIGSPALPATVEPAGTVDVQLRFAPSAAGIVTATLDIASDDLDESLVQVELRGLGIQVAPPTPSEQIAALLAFFDAAVEDGSLTGSGPGNSGQGRLRALRFMIVAAGFLIEHDFVHGACQLLLQAFRRTDGAAPPPDFVAGPAAAELAQRIEDLRVSLGCP